MKATAIQQTIALLEQEVDALEARRRELVLVIESLRPLAGEASRTRGRKRAAKRNERTNERTNERAKREPGRTARRSLPDVTKHGDAIVAALQAKSPLSPGELAKRVKLSRPALTYQVKPLLKSGTVIATGATLNRQFSLPPRSRAAKEAP